MRTGIDAVEVVEVRSEAESLDCAFNVFADVLRRVCDCEIAGHAVEPAL